MFHSVWWSQNNQPSSTSLSCARCVLVVLHIYWDIFGEEGLSCSALVGLFVPAVTGIMAGSNRSASLKDTQRSIPVGTLAATVSTSVLYLVTVLFFGALATRDKLLTDRLLTATVAWPIPAITHLGIILSTLAAALQSLTDAPSWRPQWKFHHWSLSLLGAVICIAHYMKIKQRHESQGMRRRTRASRTTTSTSTTDDSSHLHAITCLSFSPYSSLKFDNCGSNRASALLRFSEHDNNRDCHRCRRSSSTLRSDSIPLSSSPVPDSLSTHSQIRQIHNTGNKFY